MGVDWVPCRVEAGCQTEEMNELVRREALHFRAHGFSNASHLDPRIRFTTEEQERIRQAYVEMGPLYEKLLLKYDYHRISAVRMEELFPIEWRIGCERTILPWELADVIGQWLGYRHEVSRGEHRPYLQQLYIHIHLRELVTEYWAKLISIVEHSLETTGNWATRSEVEACRAEILSEPIMTYTHPPRWPDWKEGEPLELALVEQVFDKVESKAKAWNTVVKRGNYRVQHLKRPPALEEWIASRLSDERFASFVTWLEPWKAGGYGLYRDCEGVVE